MKIGNWWLQRSDVVYVVKSFNLDVVPIAGQGTLWDMVEMVKDGFDSA